MLKEIVAVTVSHAEIVPDLDIEENTILNYLVEKFGDKLLIRDDELERLKEDIATNVIFQINKLIETHHTLELLEEDNYLFEDDN